MCLVNIYSSPSKCKNHNVFVKGGYHNLSHLEKHTGKETETHKNTHSQNCQGVRVWEGYRGFVMETGGLALPKSGLKVGAY